MQASKPILDPPAHFIDPVTYEVMEDPVMCSDGHTYDRRTAEKLTLSPFDRSSFAILADNVDIRGLVFEAYPELARKYGQGRLEAPRIPRQVEPRGGPLPTMPLYGYGHGTDEHGTYYRGEFRTGRRHGYGQLFGRDGLVYTGQFVDGEMHGPGTLREPDGRLYFGSFAHGQAHGKGDGHYPDGAHYTGEWQRGKPHGIGLLTDTTGFNYHGEFVNGKMHGSGIENTRNYRYSVTFCNGVRKTVRRMLSEQPPSV